MNIVPAIRRVLGDADLLHMIAMKLDLARDVGKFRCLSKWYAAVGLRRLVRYLKVVVPSERGNGTYSEIVAFLKDNPAMAKLVRRVHIRGSSSRSMAFCNLYTVDGIVRLTPKVRLLLISFVHWTSIDRFVHLSAPVGPNSPSLSSIRFECITLQSVTCCDASPLDVRSLVASPGDDLREDACPHNFLRQMPCKIVSDYALHDLQFACSITSPRRGLIKLFVHPSDGPDAYGTSVDLQHLRPESLSTAQIRSVVLPKDTVILS